MSVDFRLLTDKTRNLVKGLLLQELWVYRCQFLTYSHTPGNAWGETLVLYQHEDTDKQTGRVRDQTTGLLSHRENRKTLMKRFSFLVFTLWHKAVVYYKSVITQSHHIPSQQLKLNHCSVQLRPRRLKLIFFLQAVAFGPGRRPVRLFCWLLASAGVALSSLPPGSVFACSVFTDILWWRFSPVGVQGLAFLPTQIRNSESQGLSRLRVHCPPPQLCDTYLVFTSLKSAINRKTL